MRPLSSVDTLAIKALIFTGVLCQVTSSSVPAKLPPLAVLINPKEFDVLGPNGTFRNSSFTEFFNPTSTKPPFFQIFDTRFLDILGPTPTLNIVSTNTSVPSFAREAPIFVPELDEIFFVGQNIVSKLSMADVETALQRVRGSNTSSVNITAKPISLPPSVVQVNGGAGPLGTSLLFVTFGTGPLPPSVVLVNPRPPFNATVLLDNFFGRQFNSLDDVKIHPTSGAIFFTDVSFGAMVGLRGPPLLPNQVYRLDPVTGSVRIVATDFQQCNGIAFSNDGKLAYITDTGALVMNGDDQTRTATIYQFDVDPKSQVLLNRRVFAYADTGIPDGIILDAVGNVYSGCGDGVNVWSPDGVLLGKVFTGVTVANMAFAGDGRLVVLGGQNIYLAKIASKAGKVSFP